MTLDLTLRCFSRARWITVAKARGILDADGNPNPGFMVDEIGLLGLPPQYDNDGNEVYPAFQDTWWWINLRIVGQAFEQDADTTPVPGEENDTSGFKFNKSKIVKFLRNNATLVNLPFRGKTIRAYQLGTSTNRIQVLDPRDYAEVRVREYYGGYSP